MSSILSASAVALTCGKSGPRPHDAREEDVRAAEERLDLRVVPEPRQRVEENVAIGKTYLEGRGPFPERLAVILLTATFMSDFARLVGEWAEWAESVVTAWPSDLRKAKLDMTALAALVNKDRASVEAAGYSKEKCARLVALKDKWDPDNLFRVNQNISPSRAQKNTRQSTTPSSRRRSQ